MLVVAALALAVSEDADGEEVEAEEEKRRENCVPFDVDSSKGMENRERDVRTKHSSPPDQNAAEATKAAHIPSTDHANLAISG